MSRKHFIAAAEVIAEITDAATRRQTAEGMARIFKQANGNFDRSKFLAACNAS